MRMDDTLRLVAIGILIYEGLEQNGEGALRLENGQLNMLPVFRLAMVGAQHRISISLDMAASCLHK